jgi:hypothetical protein
MPEVSHRTVRLRSLGRQGRHGYQVDLRDGAGRWRTVAGSAVVQPRTMSVEEEVLHCPDPQLEWRAKDEPTDLSAAGLFDRADVEQPRTLVFSGSVAAHALQMRLEIAEAGDREARVRVTVSDTLALDALPLLLGRLVSHVFLLPDGRAQRVAEPLDFAWLPNLHRSEEGVCGDHFFRSPLAMVVCRGDYAAIVPDLALFSAHAAFPQALDLRACPCGRETIEAPRLSYGLCSYVYEGHVYTRHDAAAKIMVERSRLSYGFDLFLGRNSTVLQATDRIRSFLWKTYGQEFFKDVRPQVLPFGEYGRRYTYVEELPRSVERVCVDGRSCAGINNIRRRGANFHAWENDLHVGFGVLYYGGRWGDAHLQETARGLCRLSLAAPRKEGAFPSIYNFERRRYEGTLFWTARAADYLDGYDSGAMGVTAWWSLYWCDCFGSDLLPERDELLESVVGYARFLARHQTKGGAVPTYFHADLSPAAQLLESATTAISGAVLARAAGLSADDAFLRAALAAGRFVRDRVIEPMAYSDFETYYSCSPKPLHDLDPWSGIRPHNNLSVQWACDQMLALYRLTGDGEWLDAGRQALDVLSFYQQIWNPAHRSGYLYGGFGVMNTDGEWNDGRQARFVSTYADYYAETGCLEYLQRAVAACRSSFALMDMPENHGNDINRCVLGENLSGGLAAGGKAAAGRGYAGENIHHRGGDNHFSGWTGMNWSAGGGLAAAAFLDWRFGSVWVDCSAGAAVGIDGTAAAVERIENGHIELTVANALESLAVPYTEPRQITVRFGSMDGDMYEVAINGRSMGRHSAAALLRGLTYRLEGAAPARGNGRLERER